MSELDYQPLPLKFRPRTWDDVVGQSHAVSVIRNSLTGGRIFSSYIFAGTAGCGKTTSARAFAMSLNCENLVNANPCLECISCTEALRGRNPDILEIDGPSNSGVADTRDIRERAIYAPQFKKRVFIIDEAHSLSRDAFQALLKILEEPPPHVVFIMATTEPAKIPATIHSRSIRLDFRRHTEHDVVDRLLYIASQENLSLPEEAALLIARYSDGQLRDSITVLDQLAVSNPGATFSTDLVAEVLGIVSGTELHSIMDAIIRHDALGLEHAISATLERTTEFGVIVRAITEWYRDALRLKEGAGSAVRRSNSDTDLLEIFASSLDHTQLSSALRICWDLSDKVRFSGNNPRTFFLTGLYRLMLLTDSPTEDISGPPVASVSNIKPVPVVTPVTTFVPPPVPSEAGLEDLEAQLQRLTGG